MLLVFFNSCKENNGNTEVKTTNKTQSNITIEISTDKNKLKKLINLSDFNPQEVKFKYTFMDNSKGRIAGPSNSFLEAVLYFDDKTMEKIWKIDKNTDFPIPDYRKRDFKFDWLDKEIILELERSDSLKNPHPDFIFGTENGKCWYLKNKILFIKQTI